MLELTTKKPAYRNLVGKGSNGFAEQSSMFIGLYRELIGYVEPKQASQAVVINTPRDVVELSREQRDYLIKEYTEMRVGKKEIIGKLKTK